MLIRSSTKHTYQHEQLVYQVDYPRNIDLGCTSHAHHHAVADSHEPGQECPVHLAINTRTSVYAVRLRVMPNLWSSEPMLAASTSPANVSLVSGEMTCA